MESREELPVSDKPEIKSLTPRAYERRFTVTFEIDDDLNKKEDLSKLKPKKPKLNKLTPYLMQVNS